MKWVVKNLIGGMLLFPCNVILVQAWILVAWRRRPKLARTAMIASVVVLAALSMPEVGFRLLRPLENRNPALRLEDPGLAKRADAIVVLGAGRTFDATEYSRDMVSTHGFLRVRFAADLWRKTHLPILLTGGRPDAPGPSEAALMGEALSREFGVKPEWLETESANTSENAEFSYRILAPRGIRRIFLVTHAAHMARARRSFEHSGFTVVPAPMDYLSDEGGGYSALNWVPSARGVEMSAVFFHEMIGAIWYRLVGA